MTEQEYMKLVMYHLEKQRKVEDEAYLLKKEIERLRQQVEFNQKYGIYSSAMKEIESLRKRVKWLEDRECPMCGFEFDVTEGTE